MEEDKDVITKSGFAKGVLIVLGLLAFFAFSVVVAGSFCFDHC